MMNQVGAAVGLAWVIAWCAWVGAGAAEAGEWPAYRDQVRARPVTLDTPLVRGGLARAVIVVADTPGWQASARQLQDRVFEATSVRLEIVPDSALVHDGPPASWREDRSADPSHLILLGDLTSNRVIARLYMEFASFEDGAFPGPGGYVVRSVIDPRGGGWNAVILGGATEQAVEQAIAACAATFQMHDGGRSVSIPYQLIVQPGRAAAIDRMQAYARSARNLWGASAPASDPAAESWVSLMDKPFAQAALNYATSGEPELARAAAAALGGVIDRFDQVDAQASEQTWYDLHYNLEIWLRAWQQIAHTPYLTDAQRDRGAALFAYLAAKSAVNARFVNLENYGKTGYRILSRHEYSGVFAGDAMGRYVLRHALLPPDLAREIQDARDQFAVILSQMTSTYTTGFDHKWVFDGHWHLLQWAMEQPESRYVQSGMARLNADFATMCVNNSGRWVVYGGDSTTPSEGYDAWQILGRAEQLFADGTYQWWLDRHLAGVPYKRFIYGLNWAGHWFATRHEAVRPDHLVGLNRAMIAKPIYEDLRAGRGRVGVTTVVVNDVPWESSFSKITYRDGLEPEHQYLLLDGIAGTTYNAKDANAILEYSRFGKTLLIDAEASSEPFYRNTASILTAADGFGTSGTFARLCHEVTLPDAAYVCSELKPLNRGRHRRHLFMENNDYLLLLDELTPGSASTPAPGSAPAPGNVPGSTPETGPAITPAPETRLRFSDPGTDSSAPVLACTFRSLGQPTLDEAARTWRVEQEGVTLVVRNIAMPAAGPAPRLVMNQRTGLAGTPANWNGYGNRVELLHQWAEGSPGRPYLFANLVHGEPADRQAIYRASSPADHLVRVEGDTVRLYGVGSTQPLNVGDLAIEAEAFRLSEAGLACFGFRRLSIHGEAVMESDSPVQIWIDFAAGTCLVQSIEREEADRPIVHRPRRQEQVTLTSLSETAGALSGRVRIMPGAGDVAEPARAALAMTAEDSSQPQAAATQETTLVPRMLWEADAAITAQARCAFEGEAGDSTLLATEQGRVTRVGDDGTEIWSFSAGTSPVRCLWTGRLNQQETLIVGNDAGRVCALNVDGSLRWEYQNTHHQYTHGAYYVFSAATGRFGPDAADGVALGVYGGVVFLSGDGAFRQFIPLFGHAVTHLRTVEVGESSWLAAAPVSNSLFLIDPIHGTSHVGWKYFGQGFYPTSHVSVLDAQPRGGTVVHAGGFGIGVGRYTLREQEGAWRFESWDPGSWLRSVSGEPTVVAPAGGSSGNSRGSRDSGDSGGGRLWVGTDAGFLLTLDRSGRVVESVNVGGPVRQVVADPQGAWVFCGGGRVVQLNEEGSAVAEQMRVAWLDGAGPAAVWLTRAGLVCRSGRGLVRLEAEGWTRPDIH